MQFAPLPSVERGFCRKIILENSVRLDDRELLQARELKIDYMQDYGSVMVTLGNTKVVAQCACNLAEAGYARPNEGRININFDISKMALPLHEVGRTANFRTIVGRMLDKVIRESDCINLENLCIIAGERAWQVRVDVVLLNYGGNVFEATSIAAVAALAHFRRPDVSVCGKEMTIYPIRERCPIPLHIYHYPYCVTFAFFEPEVIDEQFSTTYEKETPEAPLEMKMIMDPTETEERCADGILVVGVNSHNELCALHQRGCMLMSEQVQLCIKHACVRAKTITDKIKSLLEQ